MRRGTAAIWVFSLFWMRFATIFHLHWTGRCPGMDLETGIRSIALLHGCAFSALVFRSWPTSSTIISGMRVYSGAVTQRIAAIIPDQKPAFA